MLSMSGRVNDSASLRDMRLFKTATGELGELSNSVHLGAYVCGITPYAAAHIGHAMVYLTYDLLIRRLRDRGRQVTLVRNVTDVDDSILEYAREHDLDYADLAVAEVARFASEMAQLNIDAPDHEPRATQSIGITVELIQELEKAGFTYTVDSDIYSDVAAFGSFGRLSGYPDKLLMALAKARGDDPARPGKRNPLDFVLWKAPGFGEPSWDTKLGRGRPGWHVGCTAMSLNALGSTIDVHGGGKDLGSRTMNASVRSAKQLPENLSSNIGLIPVSSTTPAKRCLNRWVIWSSSETFCVHMNPWCCA